MKDKFEISEIVVVLHTEFHAYCATLQVAFAIVNNQWFICDPKL